MHVITRTTNVYGVVAMTMGTMLFLFYARPERFATKSFYRENTNEKTNNAKNVSFGNLRCKPRLCTDAWRNTVIGQWKLKKGLTETDLKRRQETDAAIRLKNDWPANLTRDDLRCGRDYPLPSHPRLQAQCDPDSQFPCCNHETSRCGNTKQDCDCDNCTNLRSMIPAELGTWVPEREDCKVKYFSKTDACELLNSHLKHLVFIGDSLIRQLSAVLNLVLSGDFRRGGLPQNISKSDYDYCVGEHLITNKRCSMDVAATSTDQLSPKSLCAGYLKSSLLLVQDYYPYMTDQVMVAVKDLLRKNDSYILLGVGFHYQLDHEKAIQSYIKKILDVIQREGQGWPKVIWMGLHGINGFLRMQTGPSNKKIKAYNDKVHEYLASQNVTVIDTFVMSQGIRSYDGRHYGLGFNLLKIQIFLNVLEEMLERCKT